MTNEAKFYYGTTKTLEASGSSISNNALAQADDANYDVVSDGGGYPDGEFVLSGAFSVAPAENAALAIYARPLDVDSTNDTEVPETTRPTLYIGALPVNNVTTTQYITCVGRDLPKLAAYYVHNNATGQTLGSGWTLKVTPRTYGPA